MSEEDPGIVEPRHVYWYDGRWRDANRGPPWYASMDDVRVALHPAPADPEAPFVERMWGPVNAEKAQLCGAPAAAASVLLQVHVSEQILAEVEKLIPEQIRCRPGDTAQSLQERIEECGWLDSSRVLKGGCGPGYVALNKTTYASPRRVSWSVVAGLRQLDADGDDVQTLFAYTHAGRKPEDCRARAMPLPVFDLGVQLWQVAFPSLSKVSQLHPPTACQMLLYYDIFGPNGGYMNRHRDNFKSRDAVNALIRGKDVLSTSTGHAISADGNSQIPLSDVLIWTSTGSFPMKIHLSFPSRPHRYLAHCTQHATLYVHCSPLTHPLTCCQCGADAVIDTIVQA